MSAFLKLGDIKGEASDSGHKDWITLESVSASVHRTIPSGAKDQNRARGSTSMGEFHIVRHVDASSVKLFEACANGTHIKEVEIHLCTQVKNKEEPYLKIKLSDVIVTSYSFHGTSSGDPIPTEEFALNAHKVEKTYVKVDHKTGEAKGNVVGKFSAGEGKA